MQRHLAAFEAFDAHARTRGLALAAATAGLALPGPDAAADAHAPLAGPRIVGNLIELHGTFPMRTTEDRRRRTDNFLLLSSVVRRLSSDYAHEMRDFGDHPACGRRVLQLADATDAIESEADKGLALVVAAPDRAADLLDLYGLLGGRHGELRKLRYSVAAASASVSRRRACRDDTLTFRRAATARGESWRFRASNVARTML